MARPTLSTINKVFGALGYEVDGVTRLNDGSPRAVAAPTSQ